MRSLLLHRHLDEDINMGLMTCQVFCSKHISGSCFKVYLNMLCPSNLWWQRMIQHVESVASCGKWRHIWDLKMWMFSVKYCNWQGLLRLLQMASTWWENPGHCWIQEWGWCHGANQGAHCAYLHSGKNTSLTFFTSYTHCFTYMMHFWKWWF